MIHLATKYKTLLDRNDINTPLRLAHFFAHLDHESNEGKRLVENLNYSKEGLITIFKSDFDTNNDRVLSPTEIKVAEMLARNPEAIANFVYANQGGNGGVNSGDGWKYRGRGFIQLTLRDNYELAEKETGLKLVSNPDLLLQEANAMLISAWFWKRNNINRFADSDDIDGTSDLVNRGRKTLRIGDANGYADRVEKLKKYKKAFGVK